MISDADKIFMAAARQEILDGRTFEVVLKPSSIADYDPDTNEPVPLKQPPKTVRAHVTEGIGSGKVVNLELNNGIVQVEYDVKCDIDILDWVDCSKFEYDGNEFKVAGSNKKGIGTRNRIELYGELIH